MCGKTSTTNTQSSSQPPPQVLQEYQNLINGVGGYAGANAIAATPYAPYTGQMVAPVNAQQQQGTDTINTAASVIPQTAQPLTADQIMQYYNPYQQQVIQAAENQFANTNAQQTQQLRGNAIAQGALGGDREGIAEAILAGQQQTAEAPVIAGLEQQGYTQALGTAANQFQQNPQTAAMEYAGLGNMQIGAGSLQQNTQQAQDTAAQTAYWQQQGYPFQVAAWLANIAVGSGSALGGTSQSSTTQPAPFFGLSDERAKEDIRKVGQTKDGQNLYRYRFKGSPEWHIGLLAQEVEQRHPEAVADIGGGYKGVDVHGATEDSARKGYALGGMPMGVGSLAPGVNAVPYGPLDPGLLGSGGLGQSLGVNSQVRGAGPPKPITPNVKPPQTAMDMFKQASDMADAGSKIKSGVSGAGDWLSGQAADMGIGNGVGTGGYNFIDAAAGSGPVDTAAELGDTIGEGVAAAAPDYAAGVAGLGATTDAIGAGLGAGTAAAGAAGGTELADLAFLLVKDGGRTNYPGGLALPNKNRIQLPMRAGMGMPTFVKGYDEGGTPTVVGAGDPEQLAEQARKNQLTSQEYFLPGGPPDVNDTPGVREAAGVIPGEFEPVGYEVPAGQRSASAAPPGVAPSSRLMSFANEQPTGVGGITPNYQAAPRTTTRPQLAGGPEEGPLGMSKDFWYSALAGVASMLASPSPFAGVAIGQGLLGGLGAYSGLKKGEANIEMEAQKLDQQAKAEADRIQHENDVLAQQKQFHEQPSFYQQQQMQIERQRLEQEQWAPFTDISGNVRFFNKKTGEIKDVPPAGMKKPGVPDVSTPGGTPAPTPAGTTAGTPAEPTQPQPTQVASLDPKDPQIKAQASNGITPDGYDAKPASIAAPTHPELQHRDNEFLATLDPSTQKLLKGVADYKINPAQLSYRDKTTVNRLISQYDPDWSQIRYNTIAKAMPNFTGSGMEARNMTSQDMAMQHIGSALDNIRKLDQGNIVGWNAVRNLIKGQYDPNTQAALGSISTDVQAIQNELTTAFRGSGHPSESEALQWSRKIDYNNPAGLRAALQEAASLLGGRITAAGSRFNDAVGETYARDPMSWMSTKGRAAYDRAVSLDPVNGETAKPQTKDIPQGSVHGTRKDGTPGYKTPDGRFIPD